MIKCNAKFENIEEELVNLHGVLKNSLQNDILTIKELNKKSEKFLRIVEERPVLKNAKYVIFSVFMCKDYHKSESFIFVDETGKDVSIISGVEMDLYDMIKDCETLVEAKPY